MHYKRKHGRTSRTEIRRLDQKSYRAAETRAIENGVVRGNPRTDRYSYRPEPLPIIDGVCNGPKHSKKKRPPKKEKCHVNRVHEWYKETLEERDFWTPHVRCDECLRLGRKGFYGPYVYGCRIHGEREYYNIHTHIATCIHCWKVKVLSTEKVGDDGENWYFYNWRRTRSRRRKIRTQDPVSGMTVSVK